MSIKVTSKVWDHFPGKGSVLLIMLAMADWANDDGGSIYPSMPTLTRKARLKDVEHVRRTVKKLVDDGWLEVERQSDGGASKDTTRYRICLSKLTPRAGAGPAPDTGDPPRATQLTPRAGAGQSVMDPSVRPPRTASPAAPSAGEGQSPMEQALRDAGIKRREIIAELSQAPELSPSVVLEIAAAAQARGGGTGVVVDSLRKHIATKQKIQQVEAAERHSRIMRDIELAIRETEAIHPNTMVYHYTRPDGSKGAQTGREGAVETLARYEQTQPQMVRAVRERLAPAQAARSSNSLS